ncbi:MAG: cadherin-like beta sandwich domain-containing protein [Clostridiales bacterium]|nr:cadherin-like beta sandwich domain-containing protein [Clostridiales bacterium]
MTPEFDAEVMSYTLETTNATNKVTATAADDAVIVVELNGATVENGTSVTWASGENTLTVTVTEDGKESTTYTVIVTKS